MFWMYRVGFAFVASWDGRRGLRFLECLWGFEGGTGEPQDRTPAIWAAGYAAGGLLFESRAFI